MSHYYKVDMSTETGKKLLKLQKRMTACDKAAKIFLKSIPGASIQLYQSNSGGTIAGGIVAIHFKKKPEGWKIVGESYQQLYIPLSKNKKIWETIQALPTVKEDEINEIVGWPSGLQVGEGLSIYHRPGFGIGELFTVVSWPRKIKKPSNPDLIEITGTEFEELSKFIK
jgi:hypothetical protein